MIPRPEDLTRNQIDFIIEKYKATPKGSLDGDIKTELKLFNKYKLKLDKSDTDLVAENLALETAQASILAKIKKLNRRSRIYQSGVSVSEDNIVERHFELDGEIPPL